MIEITTKIRARIFDDDDWFVVVRGGCVISLPVLWVWVGDLVLAAPDPEHVGRNIEESMREGYIGQLSPVTKVSRVC